MDAQLRGIELIGRERERAVLRQLLQAATAGQSGALVVRGEAGIGKTTLLDDAVDQAQAMTVLRTTGVQAESDLAFAGLHGLLRPILDRLDDLPSTQTTALQGALGLAPSSGVGREAHRPGGAGLLRRRAGTAAGGGEGQATRWRCGSSQAGSPRPCSRASSRSLKRFR